MIKFVIFSFKESIIDSLGKKRIVTTILHDQKSHWDFINSPAPGKSSSRRVYNIQELPWSLEGDGAAA